MGIVLVNCVEKLGLRDFDKIPILGSNGKGENVNG